jgi:hypothetical protein
MTDGFKCMADPLLLAPCPERERHLQRAPLAEPAHPNAALAVADGARRRLAAHPAPRGRPRAERGRARAADAVPGRRT